MIQGPNICKVSVECLQQAGHPLATWHQSVLTANDTICKWYLETLHLMTQLKLGRKQLYMSRNQISIPKNPALRFNFLRKDHKPRKKLLNQLELMSRLTPQWSHEVVSKRFISFFPIKHRMFSYYPDFSKLFQIKTC